MRLGAGSDLEPRGPRAGRRGAGCRGPLQGGAGAARPHRQHAPLTARRPQLRVLLGGPAARRSPRRRLRAGRAGAGRGHHGQAPRRQRRRARALHDQLRHRRPGPAGDLPGALRGGGARGRFPRCHDQLQPRERPLVHRAARAAGGRPARGVGLRRLRRHRLVRCHGHWRLGGRRCRPRDARARPGLRLGPRGRGTGRRGRRSAPGRPGDPPAHGLRPHRRPRRRRARRRDRGRPARAPRGRPQGGHRVHGAAGQRRAAPARPHRAARRGGDRSQRGPRPDHGRRLGVAPAALRRHAPSRRCARPSATASRWCTSRGCDNRRSTPVLGGDGTAAPSGAGPGFDVDWFAGADLGGDPVHHSHTPAADIFGLEPPVPELGAAADGWSFRAHTTLTPEVTGTHVFTLVQAGRGRVVVDGRAVIDGFADRPPAGHRLLRPGQRRGRGPGRAGGRAAGRGDDRVLDRAQRGRPAHRAPCPRPGRPARPGGGRRRRGGRRGAGGGHQRRVGVRGRRPARHGPARSPGRAGAPRARRQPGDRGRGERRLAGDHGLGRRRPRPAADLVRRSGDGRGPGRRAARRGRARRAAAHHPAGPARAQPLVRQLPGRERARPLRRGRAGGLPLVRGSPPARALPVRSRRVVHDVLARRARRLVARVHRRRGRAPHRVGAGDEHRRPAAGPRWCSATSHRARAG